MIVVPLDVGQDELDQQPRIRATAGGVLPRGFDEDRGLGRIAVTLPAVDGGAGERDRRAVGTSQGQGVLVRYVARPGLAGSVLVGLALAGAGLVGVGVTFPVVSAACCGGEEYRSHD